MSNKYLENLEKNTIERSFNDFIYSSTFPKKIENLILRFHQSSTFLQPYGAKNKIVNESIYSWLNVVEKTDVVPDYYEEKIELKNIKVQDIRGSYRNYNLEKNFSFDELSNLLTDAFGRDEKSLSKRYGSAGALYPVIPLFLSFSDYGNSGRGAYVYSSYEQALLKIISWSREESDHIKNNVCFQSQDMPDTCIAYAVDIRRAIIKYHIRGYRHALIEVGAMSQVFKECLHRLKDGLGEVSWSGFNDNELSRRCGLNVRLCPIMMLQWFGHIK